LARTGAALVAGAATLLAVPAAHADPKKAQPLTLACDNGSTYDVVVPGRGEWTPSLVLDSSQVLKPVAFGPSTATVLNQDGSLALGPVTFDGYAQGAGRLAARATDMVTCTYHVDLPASADPDHVPPGGVEVIDGSVTGLLTPGR
jgi:hypothetical protein